MADLLKIALTSPGAGFHLTQDLYNALSNHTNHKIVVYSGYQSLAAIKEEFDIVHNISWRSRSNSLTLKAKKYLHSYTVSREPCLAKEIEEMDGTIEPLVDSKYFISENLDAKFKWMAYPLIVPIDTACIRPLKILEQSTAPVIVWGRTPLKNNPQPILDIWPEILKIYPTATFVIIGALNPQKTLLPTDPEIKSRILCLPKLSRVLFNATLREASVVISFGEGKGISTTAWAAMKLGKIVMYIPENMAPQFKHNHNAFCTSTHSDKLKNDLLFILKHQKELAAKFKKTNQKELDHATFQKSAQLLEATYREVLGINKVGSTKDLYYSILRENNEG